MEAGTNRAAEFADPSDLSAFYSRLVCDGCGDAWEVAGALNATDADKLGEVMARGETAEVMAIIRQHAARRGWTSRPREEVGTVGRLDLKTGLVEQHTVEPFRGAADDFCPKCSRKGQ
jgi:hypothetical protein